LYKISVIIPVFNSSLYLDHCLSTVVNQTLKDIEIILIDDGSTDDSLNVIKNYAKKYNNIKYTSKENEGQAIARNIGIQMSSGEFITFIDSDDYIELNMLEKLYNIAKSDNSDIVLCDYVEEYSNKNIEKKSLYIEADNINKSYILCVAGPCSKIINSNIFKKNDIKFLEGNIYEDLAVIPALALYSNKISYCNEILYHYVIRQNSTMNQTKYSKKLESIFNVMDTLYSSFKGKGYDNELEFLYINHLLYAGCGRFLKYKGTNNMILKIIDTMNSKFPNWMENKYFQMQSKIYQLTCKIFVSNNKLLITFYKLLKRLKNT
jgi:glycosyltransferase, group 2 family protein